MSRSWLLTAPSGASQFSRGDVDLVWEAGAPVDITDPSAILDQRIRKTVQTPGGGNQFNLDLGFDGTRLLGSKNFGDETAKFLGVETSRMVATLIASQKEVASRVPMSGGEMIVGLTDVEVEQAGSDVQLSVSLETNGRDIVTVTSPLGVTNGV